MTSTARAYFDAMYETTDDPWQFASSGYEQRKYAITVASLPKPRYTSAFEPGCSIGVLTEQLADRCETLLATDIVSGALEQATERLKARPHVRVEQRAIPEDWPEGAFDLVVLSEVAYYFDEPTLAEIVDHVVTSTVNGAHVLAVHWRGETDYPLTGDRTHELIGRTGSLHQIVHHEEERFLLDVWERVR